MVSPKSPAYFKYFLALLLFGSNGIVASRIALSSSEIVFTRTLTGSLFLILVFIFSGRKIQARRNKSHFLFILLSGAAMGASWMFLFEAYVRVGVSLASLAYYCGPVLVMILSPLIFREKIAPAAWLGFLAVAAGLLAVNARALFEGSSSWGLLFGILSALMYAGMVIFNKKALSITGLENPMIQLITSFLTVALFVGLKQGLPPLRPILENWRPILLLGVVNTGIGCYFYFSSIGQLPVQTVAICGYLEPLAALLFSAIWLGETLSGLQILGAALIVGGAVFGELLRKPQQKRLASPGGL